MASRDYRNDGPAFQRVVPFDLSALTRLSWALGTRVVDDDESTRRGCWEHASSWSLSLFRVSEETVVVRVRTPVGREQFYGAAWMDLRDALPDLDAAPEWSRPT